MDRRLQQVARDQSTDWRGPRADSPRRVLVSAHSKELSSFEGVPGPEVRYTVTDEDRISLRYYS
jgi:hypothetical protein